MELAVLKKKIIEEINSSEDKELLAEVFRMIHDDLDESDLHLTEKGQQFVQEGLDQFKEGKVYSNEEAHRIFQQWKKK